MGKLVQFQRGIATVIPDCASRTVSQKASLRDFSTVCDPTDIDAISMIPQLSPLIATRPRAIALLTLLALTPAHAQRLDPPAIPIDLEPLVISALQIPQKISTVTSAVSVLDPEALQNQGILQLRDALNEAPGVISTSTSGQTGAPASLFIRGVSTKYAQIVVDGMRLSDSNNQLNGILGGARTYDVGNIEILRGPQGAIYGGESIGGVLWMETPRGSGDPRGSSTVEAGSFHTLTTYSLAQGAHGDLSYSLSGGYEETDNDAPHNHYQQSNTALRIEEKINPIWTLGTTFRAKDSSGQDLDTSYSKDSESNLTSALSTLYAIGKISDRWTARFHAGYYQESFDQTYTYFDAWSGTSTPSSYFTDLHAGSISTDHEIQLAEHLRLLAGAFAHQDTYESFGNPAQDGTRYGAHSTLEWDPAEHLTTTASLRWEDYDAFGSELTWRLGSIYTIAPTQTTLRASLGTSFRAPSYMELFYDSPYYVGNPNLMAESSLGWDIGISQKIDSHHSLETTWFHNDIRHAIGYSPDWSTSINQSGTVSTQGLELALRGSWLNESLGYHLAWTYLQAGLPNSGMPRNAASASLDWKPTDKSLIGIGAAHLSQHSWGASPLPATTLARIHGSYQITERVKLLARLENALNKNYQLYNGYGSTAQGAGTGIYAGITVDW